MKNNIKSVRKMYQLLQAAMIGLDAVGPTLTPMTNEGNGRRGGDRDIQGVWERGGCARG